MPHICHCLTFCQCNRLNESQTWKQTNIIGHSFYSKRPCLPKVFISYEGRFIRKSLRIYLVTHMLNVHINKHVSPFKCRLIQGFPIKLFLHLQKYLYDAPHAALSLWFRNITYPISCIGIIL